MCPATLAQMGLKKLLGSVFAGVGALFFTASVVLAVLSSRFHARAEHTTGEVVGLRESNEGGLLAPDVAFTTPDGRRRVHRSNNYSQPSYQIGDRVTIAYDPAEPDSAALDTWTARWLLPTIFGAIGLVDLSVGTTLLLLRRRRKQEIARLLREGPRIDARVVAVEQDTKVRVNHKHPWVIRCEGTLPGEPAPRVFTSRHFWYDPSSRVAGRSLPVHYDPRDPARHVVDTRDLPTRA